MKKILTSIALMSLVAVSNAQTTATNFTATDCSSTSHTLFTELDGGKVIVLAWVMPCSMCTNDAKAAYDAVQSFATSHPGKVLYYLIDDAGDNPCSSLTPWGTTNGITSPTAVFDNAGGMISESNYGGSGMPHIVVVGGSNHHIYFNKKNGSNDGAAITDSINSALTALAVYNVSNTANEFKITPNPSANEVVISYSKSIKNVSVISLNGRVVMEQALSGDSKNVTINISALAKGMYIVKTEDKDGQIVTQKFIKE